MGVLEIRSYTIRPALVAQFAHLMRQQSLPLLERAGTDVATFCACLDGPQSFVLIRAYRDLAHRSESQQQFYDSDAWRNGPRQAILDCIAATTDAVIEADAQLLIGLLNGLRHGLHHGGRQASPP